MVLTHSGPGYDIQLHRIAKMRTQNAAETKLSVFFFWNSQCVFSCNKIPICIKYFIFIRATAAMKLAYTP